MIHLPNPATPRSRKRLKVFGLVAFVLLGVLSIKLPAIGAALILHPIRKPVSAATPTNCRNVTFTGECVTLKGWQGRADGPPRGTLIYLHGVSDNRASASGILDHFRQRGFDVVAYDSRAHGESGGEVATFGHFEKEDLRHVLDTLRPGPIVLVGSSLGAAVALQTAAEDARISAVVAAESFCDLRTVVTERAPFFFTDDAIEESIRMAEEKGQFQIKEISPELAARRIKVPVLLIHGADDKDTPPEHSKRILFNLSGPKSLILVPGAGHNEALSGSAWQEIELWMDEVLR
jgi:pimeloyl-ACP methyl ester carboxylesterase